MRERSRPSAALIVAIAALLVALSGTAIAASQLVSGDRLIKPRSLSGNRLRNHTITGRQVNLGKLGKVPAAKNADSAKNAVTSQRAVSARAAVDSVLLDGKPGSAYLEGGALLRSGLVTSQMYQPSQAPEPQVTVLKSGPLSLTADCYEPALLSSQAKSTLYANSTEPHWLLSGKVQAGFSAVVGSDTTDSNGDESGTTIPFDLETPSGKMLSGQATIAENWPSGGCGFTAFAVTN